MRELDVTRAKILGVLIKDARLYAGRSAAECARALGITVAELDEAERGERMLTLPHLEVLAIYLEVPMAHFWGTKTLEQVRRSDFSQFLSLRDRMIGALLRQARVEAERSTADLAREIEVDEARIEAYESGRESIPFFQLERLGKYLGVAMDYFTDVEHGPLAKHETEQRVQQRFDELPPDLQEFVTNPVNVAYLQTARRLSQLDVDRLRNIAEGILDITF